MAAIAAQIPNGVVSNFSSIIISGFGFNRLQTTLLDIPSSVVQIVSLVLSGYLAGKFKNSRAIIMVSSIALSKYLRSVHRKRRVYHRCVCFDICSSESGVGSTRCILVL